MSNIIWFHLIWTFTGFSEISLWLDSKKHKPKAFLVPHDHGDHVDPWNKIRKHQRATTEASPFGIQVLSTSSETLPKVGSLRYSCDKQLHQSSGSPFPCKVSLTERTFLSELYSHDVVGLHAVTIYYTPFLLYHWFFKHCAEFRKQVTEFCP